MLTYSCKQNCLQLCLGAFCLQFELFRLQFEFYCLQLSFFPYIGEVCLRQTSTDSKQRSSTVSCNRQRSSNCKLKKSFPLKKHKEMGIRASGPLKNTRSSTSHVNLNPPLSHSREGGQGGVKVFNRTPPSMKPCHLSLPFFLKSIHFKIDNCNCRNSRKYLRGMDPPSMKPCHLSLPFFSKSLHFKFHNCNCRKFLEIPEGNDFSLPYFKHPSACNFQR